MATSVTSGGLVKRSVAFPPALLAELERLAGPDRPLAQVIRELLRRGLDDLNRERALLEQTRRRPA